MDSPWSIDPLAGSSLGPYDLHERLGAGGMGIVYRATHRRLGQPRAVKVLPTNLARDPIFVERFGREARLAAKLTHPHVVQIHDIGEHEGIHYIAMELLTGRPLRQLIVEDAPIPLPRVALLLRQLAEALDFAHRFNVAHRDVKPGNVFVDANDHLTLVDFGIARAAEEARLTGTGAFVGTAEYLSPEVVRGEEHGASSDLYALGIVAYELVTGRVPFTGASSQAILYAQAHRQPARPALWRPGLPPVVEGLVLRQIAKRSAERFPTGVAFAQTLGEAIAVEEERELARQRLSTTEPEPVPQQTPVPVAVPRIAASPVPPPTLERLTTPPPPVPQPPTAQIRPARAATLGWLTLTIPAALLLLVLYLAWGWIGAASPEAQSTATPVPAAASPASAASPTGIAVVSPTIWPTLSSEQVAAASTVQAATGAVAPTATRVPTPAPPTPTPPREPTPSPTVDSLATPTPRGAPGTVVLHETFDDGPNGVLSEQTVGTDGYVLYKDGELYLRPVRFFTDNVGSTSVTTDNAYYAVTAALDLRVEGDSDTARLGIFCPGYGLLSYSVEVEPRTGRFSVREYGDAFSSFGSLSVSGLPRDQESLAIRRGSEVNHLEVTCAANTLTVAINGQEVYAGRGFSFRSGAIGLTAKQHILSSGEPRFDNLTITQR